MIYLLGVTYALLGGIFLSLYFVLTQKLTGNYNKFVCIFYPIIKLEHQSHVAIIEVVKFMTDRMNKSSSEIHLIQNPWSQLFQKKLSSVFKKEATLSYSERGYSELFRKRQLSVMQNVCPYSK